MTGSAVADQELVDHLRRRGVVADGEVSVAQLPGGVSNEVLAVSGGGADVVVKRALRKLRVREDWQADPSRVLAEGDALVVAGRVQPDRVPAVLDIDRDALVIVIARAEHAAREWKSDLLAGTVDLDVAGELGAVLGRWHVATARDEHVRSHFGSARAFEQLRIDPFYGRVSERHPDLARPIAAVVRRMLERPTCLVHGDFSPKNVLLGPHTTWVIDWEVAHYGDPAFDVAFLLAHLVCKALHRPAAEQRYWAAAHAFIERYRATVGAEVTWDEPYIAAQTACLVLARIDGKSPAAYLDEHARTRGRARARACIADKPHTVDELWEALL